MSPLLLRLRRPLTYLLLLCLVVGSFPPSASAQTAGTIARTEDSAAAWSTSGTWSQANASDASGGTVRQSNSLNSTLSLSFNGPWVSVGLRTTTGTGIAEILIDGVSQGSIDTYSRLTGTRTLVYDDLSDGPHTLTIRVMNTKNPNSSATWVVLDYADVWDGDPLPQGTFEQDSAAVRRSTNWVAQSNAAASGGSYLRDGSNAWFAFTGTSVSVDTIAESGGGTLQIFIDGVSQGFFSLYHPTLTTRSLSFAGLSEGAHVVQVQAYRGRATIDAFRSPGSAPFVAPPDRSGVSRYEEDDPALRYDGAPFAVAATKWAPFGNDRVSRGYGIYADPVGSTVSLTFSGPWAHVGLLTTTNGGVVEVRIDGVSRGTIDAYSRYEDLRSVAYADLGPGEHTLTLTILARPSGTLGGTRLHLDYIDVWDGAAMPDGAFEHTDPPVSRSNNWVLQSNALASAGSYLRDGPNIWVPFTGESVTLEAIADVNGGQADLIIDGVSRGPISFYHPTTTTRSWTFEGLGPGGHVLQVRAYRGGARFDRAITPGSGAAHTWPSPTGVVRYEQDHPALRYSGQPFATTSNAWAVFTNDRLSGRYGIYTGTANSTTSFTVTGSWLHIGLLGTTNAGAVEVRIDGVSRGVVDTYRASEQTFSLVYPDLGPGEHTVTLTLLGTPSGRRLYLDYIDAWDGTTMSAGTFEHDSPRLALSGSWAYVAEAQASGGSYVRSGYSAWFPFTGDTVSYQAWSNGGTVELRVDGQPVETVSLQQSVAGLKAWTLSGLGEGPHVLEVRAVSGTSGLDHAVVPGRAPGAAPTGLRAIATSDTSVSLAWDAASAAAGIASYDVYAGEVLVGTTAGSSLTVNNLLAGTSYAFSVRARDTQGALSPASAPLSVSTTGANLGVTLVASLSPASATTDERVVDLVVEARDASGSLVPGYRGAIEISPSAATIGLPQSSGADYTFTAGDGGRRVFGDFAFLAGGAQTVTVSDRTTPSLTATSNAVAVQAIRFVVTVSPSTVYAGDPTAAVTLEVQDDAGNLIPGYRGTVTFGSTSAFSGLPPGGLGGARYTFTEADAGRHTWTGVTFNTAGSHTVTARDGIRTGTSAPFTVQPVSLAISVSPTTVFAGEPVVAVTVEAQDVNGEPVPGYRGVVSFSSTSGFSGLPVGGLGGNPYRFTEADAGSRTWTGVTLNSAGSHTITVGDGTRTATSAPITVQAVTLAVLVSPTTVFTGEPVVEVTVEARDQSGALVPGYRGVVSFSSTSSFSGLPVGGLGGNPYAFTEADAGRRTWTSVTLNTSGTHTITVGDGTRTASSTPITVQAVTLALLVSPTTVFTGEPVVEVTVEARDQNGALVPGYRGVVSFSSTSSFSGLPVGGLGGNPYRFTEADAGRHTWSGVTLNSAGSHTISVGDGFRTATSTPITVQAVTLSISVQMPSAFVCDPRVAVTVEARDQNGALVPGYRGVVTFGSTSGFSGLPVGGLGGNPYRFTEADAGSHTWNGVSLYSAGSHTITVGDGFRSATSASFALQEVFFRADLSGAPLYLKTSTLTLTVEVVDSSGNRVTSYGCSIDLNPTAPIQNLPQSTFQSVPDATFTVEDAGLKVFPALAFLELGSHTITVVDRGNPSRQTTTTPLTIVMPAEPTPVPALPPPPSYLVPAVPPAAPTLPYGWAEPFAVHIPSISLNGWKGQPPEIKLASPGAYQIITGASQREGWWAGTHYTCMYAGWESPATSARLEGGGVLDLPFEDPTFSAGGPEGCGGWSNLSNNGALITYGPWLPDEEEFAPLGTEGHHANIQGAGNTGGWITAGLNTTDMAPCEDAATTGNPVDVLTGFKQQREHDLGVATGCGEVELNFVRTYSQKRLDGGALGPGWVHNFEQRIITRGALALVAMPGGELIMFRDTGGSVYAGPPGGELKLVKRGAEGGWALIYRSQRVDLFDAAGRLIAQQDPNGGMLWMTYETYDRTTVSTGSYSGTRLARVDAPGGRYLWFGYDYYQPNRLTIVGDNSGRAVRFGYELPTHERSSRLTTVTNPLGETTTYGYEGSSVLLRSKTNGRGEVEFTNSFDGVGRVVQQTNSLGQTLTFSYTLVPDTEGLMAGTGLAPYLLKRVVTDQTGAAATYLFGADGLLRRLTDPAGATTEHRGYTETRKPTEVVDGLGRVTRTTYDPRGLPLTVTDALSQTTTFTYDSWGRLASVTDPLGRTTSLTYTGAELTEVTDALGQTVEMSYGAQAGWERLLSTITNQEGETTAFSYNTAGDLTAITDALNQVTRLSYDPIGRPIAITNARGITTTIAYDAADRITQVTDALGGTVSVDYDAAGNPVRVTDQEGYTSILTYTLGLRERPVVIQDARGGVVRIDYGPHGRPITVTDQLGNRVVTAYDLAGRPIAVTDPLGNVTRYGYDLLGNTVVITDANGHATTMRYDALNRPVEVRNAAGQRLQYGYDAVGNVTVLTDTLGISATIVYDALNRPLAVTDPEGRTTRYGYTPLGRTSLITDGLGIATRYLYDPLGRLEQVIANVQPGLPDGADVNVRTRFSYDPVGNLLAVTDPRNHVTSFSYDPLDRLASLTDPLNRTMRYAYDARGLLTRWEKADGTPVTFAYDAAGQRTAITAPDQTIGYSYDAAGRLTAMQDTSGTTTFAYDRASRPLTVTLSLGGSVSYGYDAVGNRTRLTYPDGRSVAYTYDEANRPATVTDWSAGVTRYDYDGNGRLITTTLPSDVATVYSYDRSGMPTRIRHTSGASALGDYQYSYDASGRRAGAIEDGRVITYTYDGLYRLLEARDDAGETYAYTYDAAGNRLTKQEPGESVTATYDAANQLLTLNGVPVQYDANGNLIDDGERSYAYDDLDRLTQMTGGGVTTAFRYNGNGDRLWQASGGVSTTFTLDLNTALTQVLVQQGGGTTTYMLPGVGQQVNGAWQYSHSDALGSVRLLTGQAGQPLTSMRYSPFGELEAQSGPPSVLGFTGEPSDPSGELLYLRARFYQPALGRFLTPDSLIPDPLNGQAWNRYAYVYNDPVNLVDPSGHIAVPILLRVGAQAALRNGFVRAGLRAGALALGINAIGWGTDEWQRRQPDGGADWFGKPGGCDCLSPPHMPSIFAANGIGSALGVALGFGGLTAETDVEETIQYLPRHKQLRYRVLGIDGIRGDPEVDIKSRVRVNPGFRVGGVPSLPGLAGSLAIGGLLDGFIQFLVDQEDPCLSSSERMWNAIEAANWGMLAGGIGSGVSYAMLSRAVRTGKYFASPLASSATATAVGAATGLGVGIGIDWMTSD